MNDLYICNCINECIANMNSNYNYENYLKFKKDFMM